MGSFFSYVAPHNDDTQDVTVHHYGRSVFGKRHPRTVLEDINKLSPQELENEFNKMCKRFTDNLKPLACGLNPCEKFCDALKTCAAQNPDHLICCFEPMRQYRECVYNHMQERLDEFLQDEPENLSDASMKDLREVKDTKEAKNVKDMKKEKVANQTDLNEEDDAKKTKEDLQNVNDDKNKNNNDPNGSGDSNEETEQEKAKKLEKEKEAKKTKEPEKAPEVKVESVG